MNKKKINILGINISMLKKQKVLNKIEHYLNNGQQHYIVTPNPEIILAAKQDEELFYVLNKADLAIPDGVGLKFAALAMGRNIERVTGADLVKDLLRLAQKKNIKVAILNWSKGLSAREDIEKIIKLNYPKLQFIVKEIDRKIGGLIDFQANILFTTLGAPYQEKLIYHNLGKMPSVKIAIGVGGAFDFLTGKLKRAPKIIRYLGLEWLWRLFKQPWRWKRIYNAALVFPYEFIKWRFVHPLLYRPNVVCLLFKRKADSYKILAVEREAQADHWQLPQGGTDGEDTRKAGIRELSEEIGTNKFKPIATFRNIYKYKFDNEVSRAGVLSRKIEGYKGQKQSLFIAEFLGKDEDIKINFWDHSAWKWVDSQDLINKVHPVRQEAAKIFLEKFNKQQNI